jgi:hypothetical protein
MQSYELPITRKSLWQLGASAVGLPTVALGLAFLNRNFVGPALIASGLGVVLGLVVLCTPRRGLAAKILGILGIIISLILPVTFVVVLLTFSGAE